MLLVIILTGDESIDGFERAALALKSINWPTYDGPDCTLVRWQHYSLIIIIEINLKLLNVALNLAL